MHTALSKDYYSKASTQVLTSFHLEKTCLHWKFVAGFLDQISVKYGLKHSIDRGKRESTAFSILPGYMYWIKA